MSRRSIRDAIRESFRSSPIAMQRLGKAEGMELGPIRLWLDDIREPPEHWFWSRTVEHAQRVIEECDVIEMSLDNDLGPDQPEGRKLVLWMAEHNRWPKDGLAIHSANPVAAEYMVGLIERYGPYERVLGRPVFRRTGGSND